MPTISEIEQSLTDAANNADMASISSIVSALTHSEKTQVNPAVFGYALDAVAIYTATDPALAASTAETFMQEVGLYTASTSITNAFVTFAGYGNLDGVDTMVNNTDPSLYSSLDSFQIGVALLYTANAAYSDPDGAVASVGNFVAHLGPYIFPFEITATMQAFGWIPLLAGIDAVVDNLDPSVYSSLDPFQLGIVLQSTAGAAYFDPAAAAASTANFLSHLGPYTDPSFISNSLGFIVQYLSPADFTAVVDSIDPSIYPSLDSFALAMALNSIVFMAFSDPEGAVTAAGHFVSLFSPYIEPQGMLNAMQNFASFGLLDGVNALIDNIAPSVYPSFDSFGLANVLFYIPGAVFFDPEAAIATTANFLSHFSLYTDPSAIGYTMASFAALGTLDGVNAVLQSTDPQVFPNIDSFSSGQALSNIASLTSSLDDHDVAATLRAFSKVLLSNQGSFELEYALQSLAGDGNLSGMGSVLDYLGSTQWDNLSPAFKSSLASLGITTGTYLDNAYTGQNGTDIYFGLGGNDAIHGKGGNDVLFGNVGEDNIKGEDGNDFLDGGIGADMLTGGAGTDTFALNNFDGIDKIKDFNKALGGDTLDFRDIISSYDAGDAITDYVQARNANGGSTILSFDADGAGTGAAFDIAKLQNVSNLDIQTLFDNGQILV